jgi:Flp pilus assembly protein TadB
VVVRRGGCDRRRRSGVHRARGGVRSGARLGPDAARRRRGGQLVLQFQLAFFGLLSTGLTFQFVSSALRGTVSSLVFFAGLVVVLVVLVPLTVRRIRRARRYSQRHGHPADSRTVVSD